MADPRVRRLAELLVGYCVNVQPGDQVMLSAGIASFPLVVETYRAIVRAGGHALVRWQAEELQEILLKEGSDEQLAYVAEPTRLAIETFDCLINLRATTNTRTLSGVDPQRQQLARSAGKDLMTTYMQRSAAGDLRWVGTLYPTNAFAQEAEMSLIEFEDFVYRACFVDEPDPARTWVQFSKRQQRLIDWLNGKEQIRVEGADIDLSLSIAGRTFANADGKYNMPDGEIFTGPVEESVNGWVRFSYPAIHSGREVSGIELEFEDGKVVRASAKKNDSYLQSMLDTDAGARYLGEFAIGTNQGITRFTKSILFDEKIGGTIHMAVGSGYPETGSKNESSIHWDMICDMRQGGKIWVDDELFYDSGNFLVP